MATSPLPSSPSSSQGAPAVAPPNFYAQAASAQPAPSAKPANSEDTGKFRSATEKLLTIFDKLEKLKPNGVDISKKIKSVAQSLKDLRSEVFEGDEGEQDDTDLGDGKSAAGAAGAGADQTNAASPPPAAPGGTAGTGA